jgi:hypothetical protein
MAKLSDYDLRSLDLVEMDSGEKRLIFSLRDEGGWIDYLGLSKSDIDVMPRDSRITAAYRPTYELHDAGAFGCTMRLEPLKPRGETQTGADNCEHWRQRAEMSEELEAYIRGRKDECNASEKREYKAFIAGFSAAQTWNPDHAKDAALEYFLSNPGEVEG